MSSIDFKLYFYQNNKLFKKVAIEEGSHNNWIVGTGDNAHIKLNNSRVSRNHLQIIYQEKVLLKNLSLEKIYQHIFSKCEVSVIEKGLKKILM